MIYNPDQGVLEFSALQPSPTSPTIQQDVLSYQGDTCFYLWSQFYPVKTGSDRKPGWIVGLVRQGWCSCKLLQCRRWHSVTTRNLAWKHSSCLWGTNSSWNTDLFISFGQRKHSASGLFLNWSPSPCGLAIYSTVHPEINTSYFCSGCFSVSCVSLQAQRRTREHVCYAAHYWYL